MLLGKKVKGYIENLETKNFDLLYICSKSKVYAKYDVKNSNFDFVTNELSLDIKKLLKNVDNFFLFNNCDCNIINDDNKSFAKSIIVIKIENVRYAIFTNGKEYFTKNDVEKLIQVSKGLKKYITR